jgi:hypothetical protein
LRTFFIILLNYIVKKADQKLQWIVNYPCDSSDQANHERGNLSFAKLQDKPDAFDKKGFVDLAYLRSYSNLQFRKLANALSERSFPLGDPIVQTVIRQV